MKLKPILFCGILALSVIPSCYAASQTACGIWLCLPMGFPAGCGAEKSAFLQRMRHFKSPLPSFSSCSKGSDSSDFTSQAPCTDWHREHHGFHHRRVCDSWKVQIYQKNQAYGQPYTFSS